MNTAGALATQALVLALAAVPLALASEEVRDCKTAERFARAALIVFIIAVLSGVLAGWAAVE